MPRPTRRIELAPNRFQSPNPRQAVQRFGPARCRCFPLRDIKEHVCINGERIEAIKEIIDATKTLIPGRIRGKAAAADDRLLCICQCTGACRRGAACAADDLIAGTKENQITGVHVGVKRNVWYQAVRVICGHVKPDLPRRQDVERCRRLQTNRLLKHPKRRGPKPSP